MMPSKFALFYLTLQAQIVNRQSLSIKLLLEPGILLETEAADCARSGVYIH